MSNAENTKVRQKNRMGRPKGSGRFAADAPRTQFRMLDKAHHNLIKRAVEKSGLTLNGWLINCTLKAARAELEIK